MTTSEPQQATSVTTEGAIPSANPAETGSSQNFLRVDWAGIVAQVKDGGDAGLEQLYHVFSRGLRYFLIRQLGTQDFEDKLHETFLITAQAIRKGEIRNPESLPGFIRTVAHRQVAGYIERQVHLRTRQAEISSDLYVVDQSENPEQEAIRREKMELMQKALATLRRRDREVLVRFYLQEQRPERICQEMNLTETQFRLIKSRAKAAFGDRGKAELKTSGGALAFLSKGTRQAA
jgi:RNA polymerase sigma factor (sigma-70 family)